MTGLARLAQRQRAREIRILAYHAISGPDFPFYRSTHVREAEFDWQMRFLRRHYQVLPLSTVIEAMQNGGRDLPQHVAVLTFDDGFASVYRRAFPILQREQLPATVFLATGFVDGAPLWTNRVTLAVHRTREPVLDLSEFGLPALSTRDSSAREHAARTLRTHMKSLPVAAKNAILHALEAQTDPHDGLATRCADEFDAMRWSEAREMQRSNLIEFGAHTVRHEILSQLPAGEARREVERSLHTVRERLGADRVPFAYPNGKHADFNSATKSAVRSAGLTCALTTVEGFCRPGDDLFALPRISVGRGLGKSRFAALCCGLLSDARRWLGRP